MTVGMPSMSAPANLMDDNPAALGDTEVHDLWSDAVGDTFRIFIGRCGDEPTSTLLVTDANGLFGIAVDSVRSMQLPALVPSMLVVGVGYPAAANLFDTIRIRARDLTPTHTAQFGLSGAGDAFMRFLRDELQPWLTERFPGCADDVTYFGHSLGGMFGSHLLVTEPSLFRRFILSSPSLWWDDELAFRTEEAWADAHDDLESVVYFGIGGNETDAGRRIEGANLPDGHPAKPPAAFLDMVDDLRRFVSVLQGRHYDGLDLAFEVFDDEFHATVPGVVLSRALRHFRLHEPARERGRPN